MKIAIIALEDWNLLVRSNNLHQESSGKRQEGRLDKGAVKVCTQRPMRKRTNFPADANWRKAAECALRGWNSAEAQIRVSAAGQEPLAQLTESILGSVGTTMVLERNCSGGNDCAQPPVMMKNCFSLGAHTKICSVNQIKSELKKSMKT